MHGISRRLPRRFSTPRAKRADPLLPSKEGTFRPKFMLVVPPVGVAARARDSDARDQAPRRRERRRASGLPGRTLSLERAPMESCSLSSPISKCFPSALAPFRGEFRSAVWRPAARGIPGMDAGSFLPPGWTPRGGMTPRDVRSPQERIGDHGGERHECAAAVWRRSQSRRVGQSDRRTVKGAKRDEHYTLGSDFGHDWTAAGHG